ncbi:MAG: hypothetical protein IKR75_05365 [Fibrobacter sp.]|jgi:hypothetical protein|uniref:hypothetical protein n=1 Tax=uncultured Fibrobacter sp. TaxID=261512 RepID=UPI0015645DA0|nr:hypothetical protein [uncultured Fibrobacter sp.]MBQ1824145.1 hypothetical protein [Fibrobacter sp.]MBR6317837.1 hypothetical protein [Fibrobacter sp.]
MKKFLTVVSVALFIAACGDDSSSSVDLVLRPPPDESFNAEAVEDSTGAEISLSVMGTSFVCDRVTEDSSVVVTNELSGLVDAWSASASITVEVTFKKYSSAAKEVVDATREEFGFSKSQFKAEDEDKTSYSGSKTISMKLKDLPKYLKSHCDTSKAKNSKKKESEEKDSEEKDSEKSKD